MKRIFPTKFMYFVILYNLCEKTNDDCELDSFLW